MNYLVIGLAVFSATISDPHLAQGVAAFTAVVGLIAVVVGLVK